MSTEPSSQIALSGFSRLYISIVISNIILVFYIVIEIFYRLPLKLTHTLLYAIAWESLLAKIINTIYSSFEGDFPQKFVFWEYSQRTFPPLH